MLRAKLRSAQYQYWYRNANMWMATGSLCQWAFKRFTAKKRAAHLSGKMWCARIASLCSAHISSDSFSASHLRPGTDTNWMSSSCSWAKIFVRCLSFPTIPVLYTCGEDVFKHFGASQGLVLYPEQCLACPFHQPKCLQLPRRCLQAVWSCYRFESYIQSKLMCIIPRPTKRHIDVKRLYFSHPPECYVDAKRMSSRSWVLLQI